jgi:hypothetical protein
MVSFYIHVFGGFCQRRNVGQLHIVFALSLLSVNNIGDPDKASRRYIWSM